MPDDDITIVVPKQLDDEQTKRADRAELCLWQLLQAAKQQTDPAVWLNLGLLEAEAFMEAIYTAPSTRSLRAMANGRLYVTAAHRSPAMKSLPAA